MSNTEYDLRRQTEAAKDLMRALREHGADEDDDLVADAIEGETSLHEALCAAIEQDDEDDALEIGLKAVRDRFDSRLASIKARRERRKALIEQALLAAEQTTIKLPAATLSIAKRAPSPVIINEADIPARFFVEQARPAPKLDKKALTQALRDGEEIAGATLDNGTVSLTVRRK
ncbi:hypothetical protein GCM10007989_07720 [Devosia pacifica]|uniref:Viral Gp157 protein n=1 Tax=Devosia pacifica TaxID=1335967 RepID=A0A918RXR9_9HYPH|nr:siphovirus Gp157 family protein [Devosia pacifica]GHA15404.1 hypothetical protein GCM10007989_07720 [Devosia pacifica]